MNITSEADKLKQTVRLLQSYINHAETRQHILTKCVGETTFITNLSGLKILLTFRIPVRLSAVDLPDETWGEIWDFALSAGYRCVRDNHFYPLSAECEDICFYDNTICYTTDRHRKFCGVKLKITELAGKVELTKVPDSLQVVSPAFNSLTNFFKK